MALFSNISHRMFELFSNKMEISSNIRYYVINNMRPCSAQYKQRTHNSPKLFYSRMSGDSSRSVPTDDIDLLSF